MTWKLRKSYLFKYIISIQLWYSLTPCYSIFQKPWILACLGLTKTMTLSKIRMKLVSKVSFKKDLFFNLQVHFVLALFEHGYKS